MRRMILGVLALEIAMVTWLAAAPRDGSLPDPALTPGAVTDVAQATLCQIGYAASVRHYDRNLRNKVFAAYGYVDVDRRAFEVDHLIPISLGGAPDDLKNPWPESRVIEPWGAEVKDTLEDVLHRQVCDGRIPLKEAQDAIRTNWIKAYLEYIGPEPGRFAPRSREPQ